MTNTERAVVETSSNSALKIGGELFPKLYVPLKKAIEIVGQEGLLEPVSRVRALWIGILAEQDMARIGFALERLASHYPNAPKDDAAFRVWAEDFLADFKGTPPLVFEEACRDWRNSPERWMPTPGQLRPLVDRIRKRYEAELRHLEAIWTAVIGGGDGC